jgi:eukaryotic-like serine/threonine-protein kinase
VLHCTAVDDPRIGRVVAGRYKLLSQLAEGGMGIVYRAERVGIGRPVVVKFLHAMLSDKAGIVDRFEREARATAILNHPNCVALVDFGLDDGSPFLVMELAEGQTLADLLDRGPLAPTRAVNIILQVLAGLSHAHERGILHRDLKPANVMIVDAAGTRDFVKILDFGLAKMVGPLAGDLKRDVTVEGIAIGTPGYMSPEQAAGIPSDRRADIYCTGALLYHMVTGAKAFEGEDLHSILRRHREETPISPAAIVPQVKISMPLEDVILRAMKREPGDRFQSADEMAKALKACPEARLEDSSRSKLPASQPSVRPVEHSTKAELPSSRSKAKKSGHAVRWLLVGGLTGAIGTAAGIWYLQRPPEIEMPAVASLKPTPKPAIATTAERPAPAETHPPVETRTPAEVPAAATPSPTPSPAADDGRDDDPKADDGAGEDDRSPPEVPAAPRREVPQVRTLADARALARRGDSDGALAGLNRLQRARPAPAPARASEIAQLIGHLYFDRKWWTDGLREYRFAITVDGHAKSDALLVGNTIRALGDRSTAPRARRLLLQYVGRGAVPALRRAARSGPSPLVRKNAAAVLAQLAPGKSTVGRGRGR